MKIGFIGGGNMATALVGGLIGKGVAPADVLIIDHAQAALDRHAARGIATSATIDAQLAACDAVVFAIKPQHFHEVARQAAEHVGKALIISIAAGIRLVDVARWLDDHPRIVRAMPNTPALIGQGITGVTASPAVTADDRALVNRILDAAGQTLWFEADEHLSADDRIDAVTAISGSGPAYLFAFIEALEAAAGKLGFNAADARTLSIATVEGAAALAVQATEPPSVLRERVTSPGGTTAAALASFAKDHFDGVVLRGAEAANARAKTLAQEFGAQ